MSQVELDQIPENARLTPARVMELTGLSRSKVFVRLGDHPHAFTWAWEPNPARGPKLRKTVDARSLPADAVKRWQESQLAGAFLVPLQPHQEPTPSAADGEMVSGAVQLRLLATSLPAVRQQAIIDARLRIVTECKNGSYATYGFERKMDFLESKARESGLSVPSLYRIIRQYEKDGIRGLAKGRPGPEPTGAGSKVLAKEANSWMRSHLEENYRAGLSKAACHRLLIDEIKTRQAVHPTHAYDLPKEFQSKTFLASLPPINETAREKGVVGLRTAAGYCDRLINELAGDAWCIDEWQVDAHLYLDWKMREVIRPYIITLIDERSEAILGWKLVVNPNSDAVLDLTEECIKKCWKPLRWYSDRGGHFRGKVGRHFKEVPNEKRLEKAIGALGRFDILHQGPRVKNPRANRIERSVHGFYASKALETLAGSSCGNTSEAAEALGVYARVARHKELCKSGDVRETDLLSYKQLKAMIPAWVDEYNRAFSDANGLQGLSREAAFRTFSPPADLRQARAVDETEMAFKFAEHFEGRKIREGGVIDLGERDGERFRYYSPVLTLYAGARALVRRLRHRRSFVVVEIDTTEGKRHILADRRTQVGIGDTEGIAKAQEERNRVAKYLEATYGPVVKARGNLPPIPPPDLEIGSSEFIMHGGRAGALTPVTSEEVARRALEMELGR
ncbi:MAG TPA: hypothetical protein VMT20_21445 [Terriglobia bacterium]|nr:hypothetical protein [Terriglobia bacterium]